MSVFKNHPLSREAFYDKTRLGSSVSNSALRLKVRVEGVQSSALKTFQFPQRDRIKDYV